MSIIAPKITPPTIVSPYPGLSEIDNLLADKYLRTRRGLYQKLYWDWCIGEAWRDIPQDMPPQYLQAAIRGSALRMDMVAVPVSGSQWELVEYRHNAGTGAIGAIICYRTLWPREAPPNPKCIIVTDFVRRDIRTVATAHGIEIVQV